MRLRQREIHEIRYSLNPNLPPPGRHQTHDLLSWVRGALLLADPRAQDVPEGCSQGALTVKAKRIEGSVAPWESLDRKGEAHIRIRKGWLVL